MKEEHKKLGYLEGIISIVANLLLFIVKYTAGAMSGSIALMADAWHTLSDSFTSLIIIFSTKISSKPADKDHPFGHGRIEIISSVIIGILLAIVAFNFTVESITNLTNKKSADFGLFAIIVTIISIVVKEGLAQFAFKVAGKTGSSAIKADGWHHRSDALSSLVVLVGIFLSRYFWWIDSVLGILVALMIAYATVDILKNSINNLIGQVPDKTLVEKIKKMALEFGINPGDLHHLHIHCYGQHAEMTFHIRLNGNFALMDAHKIATELENRIREELQIEATIHMEPLKELDK